jgi:hypothetical protein
MWAGIQVLVHPEIPDVDLSHRCKGRRRPHRLNFSFDSPELRGKDLVVDRVARGPLLNTVLGLFRTTIVVTESDDTYAQWWFLCYGSGWSIFAYVFPSLFQVSA